MAKQQLLNVHHAFCAFRSLRCMSVTKRPNFTHRLHGVKFQKNFKEGQDLGPPWKLAPLALV